ncbi:MAG: hypothetical protein LBH73_04885 [Spirochaetaceae bacterium]|jgi:hypothetical protein|nr:hypothetical protein [Spirochaetaceae bacterium]
MVSAFWVFSGVLILWGISFLYFRSYIKRLTGAERILGKFRDEVDQLVAEINAATDRDLSLIEDRINSLRKFLDDADRRIKLQHTELKRRSAEEEAYAALGKRHVVKLPSAVPPVRLEPRPAETFAPPARPEQLPAEISGPHPAVDEAGPVPGAIPAAELPRLPRFVRSSIQIEPKEAPFAERVMDLYQGGFSAEIIAGKLGSTIAEVDLVIALAEQQTRL